jgi:hypothetical protein
VDLPRRHEVAHSKHVSGFLVVVSGLAIGCGNFVPHDRITPEGLL